MKSIRRTFATKEDREKLVVVGEFNNPATNYTKDDFMTAGKVGKKFNISTKEAQDMMKKLNFRRASFVLNNHLIPIIVRLKGSLYLHPMALEAFQRHLDKQKA